VLPAENFAAAVRDPQDLQFLGDPSAFRHGTFIGSYGQGQVQRRTALAFEAIHTYTLRRQCAASIDSTSTPASSSS
jgi:hypothetical protein